MPSDWFESVYTRERDCLDGSVQTLHHFLDHLLGPDAAADDDDDDVKCSMSNIGLIMSLRSLHLRCWTLMKRGAISDTDGKKDRQTDRQTERDREGGGRKRCDFFCGIIQSCNNLDIPSLSMYLSFMLPVSPVCARLSLFLIRWTSKKKKKNGEEEEEGGGGENK